MTARLETGNRILRVVLALVLLTGLTLAYIVTPQANPSPTWEVLARSLCADAIMLLSVYLIVELILSKSDLTLEDRIARVFATRDRERVQPIAGDVTGAAPEIRAVVDRHVSRGSGTVKVEILAYTGASYYTAVLRDLIRDHPGRIALTLRVIDLDKQSGTFPSAWPGEIRSTIAGLKDSMDDLAELHIWTYPRFPFVIGLKVGETDLFVAFPRLTQDAKKVTSLRGGGLEYRHFTKHRGIPSEYDFIFDIFDSWDQQPDQEIMAMDDV